MMRIFIIQVHDPVIHLEVDEELFKEKKQLLKETTLFFTFSVLIANPKKLLYTWSVEHGGKKKVWQRCVYIDWVID